LTLAFRDENEGHRIPATASTGKPFRSLWRQSSPARDWALRPVENGRCWRTN